VASKGLLLLPLQTISRGFFQDELSKTNSSYVHTTDQYLQVVMETAVDPTVPGYTAPILEIPRALVLRAEIQSSFFTSSCY
jgi:hypothetical protein